MIQRTAAAVFLGLAISSAACASAPAFYPQPPQASLHAEAAPFATPYNHGIQAPAFRWGWFGAEHFYPSHRAHRDTTGDVMRWSRWRRH